LAGLAGVAAAGPGITAAEEADDRYIIDVGDEVAMEDRVQMRATDAEIVHDLEYVGYFVVRGSESSVEGLDYQYTPDIRLERELGPNCRTSSVSTWTWRNPQSGRDPGTCF
jgi:hypothetical protein